MARTNVIDSAFVMVETFCRNAKRWHGATQRGR
jgi:hypothetical protein